MQMATTMDDLPDGLQVEILHRLPLKSAFQCKSVKKRWYSLISTSHFVSRFVSHREKVEVNRPFSFIYRNLCKTRLFFVSSNEIEFKCFKSLASKNMIQELVGQHNKSIDFSVQASCNEMLLCCANNVDVGDDGVSHPMSIYYVINPITMQWLALPPVPQWGRPLVGFICFYDNDSKQLSYRVVRILPINNDKMEIKVDMFSSDSGEWNKSLEVCPQVFDWNLFALAGVAYDGLLFWYGKTAHNKQLVGCDPYNFRFFELPIQMEHPIKCLGVCRGSLRICEMPSNEHSFFRIWELRDFVKEGKKGGTWCLEHEVYFDQMTLKKSTCLAQYFGEGFRVEAVLAFHPNDGDILYLLIKTEFVVLCNMREKTLQVIYDVPVPRNVDNDFKVLTSVLPWWPTLIPSSPMQDAA